MDLKPENILLTSIHRPTLKVADFGVAQHIGRQGSRSIRGTLLYMAPEILSSRPYDNRVDLWSIGIILYECLFGRPPFIFSSVDELIEEIKSNIPIEIPNDARISSDCRDLLEGLLQRDPNRRISFRDFFQHPFIVNNLSSQIIRADDLFQKSINYEQSGDFKKALDYRVRALDEYVAIIKVDVDEERRRMLRTKVKQGVAASETLKKRMRESPPRTRSVPTTVSPSPSENFDLKNDKELSDAYQHCLNGNQLMNVARFGQACEEYQIGLTVMLRAAKTETDPGKSKILHNVISFYLNKAEICKSKNEAQQLDNDMAKIREDSALDNTMIDESNLNSDKKQQSSSSQQNCCLQ
jgi:serine/threonine protein kinase